MLLGAAVAFPSRTVEMFKAFKPVLIPALILYYTVSVLLWAWPSHSPWVHQ